MTLDDWCKMSLDDLLNTGIYKQLSIEIFDNKKYFKLENQTTNLEGFYDKEGKLLKDYGGQHYAMFNFIKVDGKNYRRAKHEENGLQAFYDKEGNILQDYGGQHQDIRDFVEIDGKTYLKARHEENGLFGFYDKKGNILQDFGGQHHLIYDFVEIEGKTYLNADHEKKGPVGFYDKKGNILQDYGGQHHYIYNFVEIGGKKYLKAHDNNRLGFYDKEGNFYADKNEIYSEIISTRFGPEMIKKYNQTKQMIKANYCHENNKDEAVKAFNETISKIINENKPDMKENVNFILDSVQQGILDKDILECKR